MQSTKKTRQSNFELMRIISMFIIVLCHNIGHGKMLEHSSGVLHFLLQCILFFGVVHVNSFVLVSGYFQYKSKFSIHKLLKTINQQWFYKAVLTLIFVFCGIQTISNIEFFNNLLPLDMNGNYWFINCYIALYALSPFINKFIENITQKEHRLCIISLLLLFSIIPMLTNGYTISNTGFTIIQFVLLYLIGAYLHKYPIKDNFHLKNYSKNKRQIIFIFGMIFFSVLNFSFSISAEFLQRLPNPFIKQLGDFYRNYSISYSNIFVIFQSVFYFLFFETLSINSSFINKIGKYTIGVYLISDHVYMRQHLYHWLGINKERSIISLKYLPYIFVCAIAVFCVCIVIEIVRDKLFERIKKLKLYKKMKNKVWVYLKEI